MSGQQHTNRRGSTHGILASGLAGWVCARAFHGGTRSTAGRPSRRTGGGVMTKKERRRKSPDGLPIDATEWTAADWADLHRAMETVRRLVAGRHSGEDAGPETVCPHCRGTGTAPLGRAYRATWEKIKNLAGEFTAAMLAKSWGVPATRVNNQLAALERHGLLSSSPNGRERLFRVREGAK